VTAIKMLGKQGAYLGFEVSGHTGAGTEGNDLVCAAISFLATTCVNALESVAGVKAKVRQSDAYIRAELTPGDLSKEADVILRTFHQGATDLQQAYPAFVKLNDETN
jgi:uncharacterized protein YsxB (DUF464 family)